MTERFGQTVAIVMSGAAEQDELDPIMAKARTLFIKAEFLQKPFTGEEILDLIQVPEGGVIIAVDDRPLMLRAVSAAARRAIRRECLAFTHYSEVVDALELQDGVLTVVQADQRTRVAVIFMDVQGHPDLPPLQFLEKLEESS